MKCGEKILSINVYAHELCAIEMFPKNCTEMLKVLTNIEQNMLWFTIHISIHK